MRYELKRSARARSIRIAVYPGGDVVVTAPPQADERMIGRFVADKREWAQRAVARMSAVRVIHLSRADIPRLKAETLRLAEERVAYYAKRYGFAYGKIGVRAQRSRWGSCSKAGNLSFNFKIAALPREIAEYVIVHEVCHLGAFDHSRRFWELVEREVPNHRELRRALRSTAFRFS